MRLLFTSSKDKSSPHQARHASTRARRPLSGWSEMAYLEPSRNPTSFGNGLPCVSISRAYCARRCGVRRCGSRRSAANQRAVIIQLVNLTKREMGLRPRPERSASVDRREGSPRRRSRIKGASLESNANRLTVRIAGGNCSASCSWWNGPPESSPELVVRRELPVHQISELGVRRIARQMLMSRPCSPVAAMRRALRFAPP
jgi:hypothetical protein